MSRRAPSGTWPLRIGEREFWIPGLMMWVAILDALLSTYLTHRVGRTLVGINFDRLRFEADFRYALVRFRDHVEVVALARGQEAERRTAMSRFHEVITNWWELITKQRNLTLLTSGIGQANGIVPLLVAAPAFFAGRLTLGGVTQTGMAYGQGSGAPSWFVDAYQEIAAWRASIERLATFVEMLEETQRELEGAEVIQVRRGADGALRLVDLALAQPDGTVLAAGLNGTVSGDERVAVVGPPGVLKTMLFRAIAGIWPFGRGRVEMPADTAAVFLSHQPYLPSGSLREAVCNPSAAAGFSDEQIRETMELFELHALAGRLDESEPWEQQLSGDEQQRLMFARAVLQHPECLVLDDATSALDETSERRVYEVLRQRLPAATVLSITNRPGVARYHQRRCELRARRRRRGDAHCDLTPRPTRVTAG